MSMFVATMLWHAYSSSDELLAWAKKGRVALSAASKTELWAYAYDS